MRCFTSLALAGAFGTLIATAAQAADMAFPAMEGMSTASVQPVELGTGWYLRGDVGWSRDKVPLISSNMDLTAASGATNSYSLDFGFGYKFNNWLRADIVYDYRKPQIANPTDTNVVWCPYGLIVASGFSTSGLSQEGYYANPNDTCTPQQSVKLSNQDLLLNGYVDLGTWGGVTPYVGAGAGMVRTQSTGTVNYHETANGTLYNANLTPGAPGGNVANPIGNPQWVDINGNPVSISCNGTTCTTTLGPPQPKVAFTQQNLNKTFKSTKYGFAWALMGGFAIDVTDHLKLDLGYRYVNLGTFTGIDATSGQIVKEKQSTQEIRLGFRYMVD